MRVDTRTGENWPAPPGKCYQLFLDGVDVSDDSPASDEEAGTVVLYRRDGNGNILLEGEGPDLDFAVEEKRGKVELRVIDLPLSA